MPGEQGQAEHQRQRGEQGQAPGRASGETARGGFEPGAQKHHGHEHGRQGEQQKIARAEAQRVVQRQKRTEEIEEEHRRLYSSVEALPRAGDLD